MKTFRCQCGNAFTTANAAMKPGVPCRSCGRGMYPAGGAARATKRNGSAKRAKKPLTKSEWTRYQALKRKLDGARR